MLKNYKVLIIVFFTFFANTLIYAQRAETSVERNDDVKSINDLYNKGAWEEGKVQVEANLKKNTKDSDMRMLLGKYYLHKKQYDKARYELVKSLEFVPSNVDAKHMLVTVETETKRFSSAICYINELLEVNPYWKGLWRKKIDLYRTMGNQVEADRLLKRISQIYPEDNALKQDQNYTLQQQALAVQKAGKLDEVIAITKKRVENQPQEQSGYVDIIDNYIKAGDYSNALIYTERALNTFPGSSIFIQKKISILDHNRRYPEILAFLEQQMKRGGQLRSEYSYFLLEAARSAKNAEAAVLYAKIFNLSPNNREAFDYLFADLIGKEQYEEAIGTLNKHKKSVIGGKDLDMKELMVYKRLGDANKISALTRQLFVKYPEDSDLRDSYVNVISKDAKDNMLDGELSSAISNWRLVIEYGDEEAISTARRGLYNAYQGEKRYQDAIIVLDDMLMDSPGNIDLILKKSDLYFKDGRFDYAITLYEQVLGTVSEQDRDQLMSAYNEMMQGRVKSLRENFQLAEARQLSDRWLTIDQKNQDALLYMINICYQMKDKESMLRYAQIAEKLYGDNVSFKIKLAEAMNHTPEKRPDSWSMLHDQVQMNAFHDPLLNTFVYTTEEYAGQLLKVKDYAIALNVLDTTLHYKDNRELKYLKGLAFEGLKKYDSAYVYQQFYEPSLLEFEDYKNHLNYLAYKSFRNNVGFSYLRARYGDDYKISSISSIEYNHFQTNGASYSARFNYAGRDEGKGIQGQVEWSNPWTEKISTRLDLALSNKFFAKIAFNAAGIYAFLPTWESEVNLGYRRLFTENNLVNVNIGASKTLEDFILSLKVSNLFLDSDGEMTYLYSVGAKAQYFMNNPKNYITVLGSVGNSPDIDVLDNQFYNSFNVFNAMVGGGVGRSLSRNMSANVMGTWYNFQTDKTITLPTYRNFYNLYLQLNVSF